MRHRLGTVAAVAGWRWTLTWRTLRWLPPLLFQVAAVAVLCSSRGQPVTSTLAETAVVTFACSAWLAVAHGGSERADHVEILDVAVGPLRRVLGTAAGVVPLLGLAAVVATVGSVVAGGGGERSPAGVAGLLAAGLAGQLAAAVAGYAVGATAHRVGGGNRGRTVVAALLLGLLVLARPAVGVLAVVLPPVTDAARQTAADVTLDEAVEVVRCIAWALVVLVVVGCTGRPSVAARRHRP